MASVERSPHRMQLSEEVASYLRQAIMAGEYLPGQAVRAEAVAGTLDVSQTPVREAMHSLRAEGFLDLAPRKGFAVAPLVADDIRDIFEAYALIAGELSARAARNGTPEQVAELQGIHKRLMEAGGRGDADSLEQLNHEFHRLVYLMAGSNRLRWALGAFVKYVPRRFYAQIDGWPETTVADHAQVLEAIVSRNSTEARFAMAQHIRNSGEKLAEYFAGRRRLVE